MNQILTNDIKITHVELYELMQSLEIKDIKQLKNYNFFDLLYLGYNVKHVLKYQTMLSELILRGKHEGDNQSQIRKMIADEKRVNSAIIDNKDVNKYTR